MLLTSLFSKNSPVVRARWRVAIPLAALVLVGSSSAYLLVRDVGRGRELKSIKSELAAVREGTRAESIDKAIINESFLAKARLTGGVYLTAQLTDGSLASATVLAASVTNGQLAPNATIQYPDGTTSRVTITMDGLIRGWQLGNGSVTTAKIIDSAVTVVKLAKGAVTEVKILNGAVKSKKIASGQIKAQHLASGSVVTAKIKNGAITGPKIANNSITAGKIANRSLSTDKFIDQSITDDQLMNGAVGSDQLADGSVTTRKLADGSVTTPKIADNAVTAAKVANLSITAAKIATGTITATQIASDGGVVKSIVGNSIVAVTNNNNGSYSIALTTSCSEGQILKFSGGAWQCAADADTGYFTPQDILRYPSVGTQQTDWWDNGTDTNFRHATEPNYLLYLGAGQSGVVRNVWMTGTVNFTNWTSVDDYELRIYIGAGDIANVANPPAAYLTTTIPLGIMLGAVYDSSRTANQPVETSVLDYARSSVASPLINTPTLSLNLPIPFENGVLIQVWKRSTNTVDLTLSKYHWVSYEVGATTFPYQTWRLKAQTLRDSLQETDQNVEFFNVASKPGMLAGIFSSTRSVGDVAGWMDYNEANWTFYPDGASQPVWQTSGAEDLFGINPFYYAGGEITKHDWGTTQLASGAVEGYRLFIKDPLIWQNGIRGVFPNGFFNAGYEGNLLDVNFLTLYYAEK